MAGERGTLRPSRIKRERARWLQHPTRGVQEGTSMDAYKRSTLSELARLVADATAKAPELGARPAKAASALLTGKVSRTADDSYEVVSSDGSGAYTVDHRDGTCSCPDFKHRGATVNGARLCAHRLAVLFLRRLERPRRPSARAARLSSFRPAMTRRPLRKAA
jgi:hypothetical protein